MDLFLQTLSMMGNLSFDSPKCSNPSCPKHERTCKACAACGIVQYCCKECQKSDWTRHKPLCIACRPFAKCPIPMPNEQKLLLDKYSMLKLPPVDKEYKRKHGFTHAVDIWMKTGLRAVQEMLSTNISCLNKEDSEVENLLKRWQEVSPALFRFLRQAQPGDIFLENSYNPYTPGAPQQFRNTPLIEPLKLDGGKIIVDIGFVDFGMVFDSIMTLDLDDCEPPLKIIGYEASPHCIAKTLVMLQMMKNNKVNARSIIEVWLNSLWSKQTARAFKRAVSELPITNNDLNRQVKLILKYWETSVAKSREAALLFQLKGAARVADSTAMMNCCSLEKETDRIDYIRYFLTKALYEDESTVVGSVVMNNEKEQIGVKQIFESCVEAAPYSLHCVSSSRFASGESFMGRMRRYFETSMDKFMTHVRNGSLVFTPKHGVLSPDNHSMIKEIKSMDPYLVHWSNVIDYIQPKAFHIIAKEISGSDTVHVAHSCNWTSLVMGTDIYDVNPAMRLHFYSGGLMSTEMFTSFTEGIATQAPAHFRNTCSIVLARKYIKKFFQYFFENEDVNCGCVNGETPLTMPFPFLRSIHTAHFLFTYKSTGIQFEMDTYDYLNDDV